MAFLGVPPNPPGFNASTAQTSPKPREAAEQSRTVMVARTGGGVLMTMQAVAPEEPAREADKASR